MTTALHECCMCSVQVRLLKVWNKAERRIDMQPRTCPTCERPLCLQCADKDEEISERCAECCASRTAAASRVGVVEMVGEKEETKL